MYLALVRSGIGGLQQEKVARTGIGGLQQELVARSRSRWLGAAIGGLRKNSGLQGNRRRAQEQLAALAQE